MKSKMRLFTIEVMTMPMTIDMMLLGTKPERRLVTIRGTSLKDAKRRAGIQ